MARIIVAPEMVELSDFEALFLAGGVTGAPLWQNDLIEMIKDLNIDILNPRRANYIDGDEIGAEQVKWEFHMLHYCDVIMFWFPKEARCMITLYELGKCCMMEGKKLFIGVHPEYERAWDVKMQTSLLRPDLPIYSSLEEMVVVIKKYFKGV